MAPDQMTTTKGGPVASEAVMEALANLRAAMIDDGMDEGTADAFLRAATPRQESLVGNLADLMRAGADGSPLADEEAADFSVMTKVELQAAADAAGIEYVSSNTKAELVAALEGGG